MKIGDSKTDTAALTELGSRLARIRLDSNLTQAELADESGVSKRTIERLESGGSIQLGNLLRVLRALGLLDRIDALVPETLPSPVEQLRLAGKKRVRVRKKTTQAGMRSWTWGDEP